MEERIQVNCDVFFHYIFQNNIRRKFRWQKFNYYLKYFFKIKKKERKVKRQKKVESSSLKSLGIRSYQRVEFLIANKPITT